MLHCLDLENGKVIWKRDLKEDYQIPQYFFGYGPNPMIWDDLLILNVGGKEKKDSGTCVAALDRKTGKTRWTYDDAWGASYASPVITKMHGREVALILAAGESRPAHGGLLLLDPKSGELLSRFPWRADIYESVLASLPCRLGTIRSSSPIAMNLEGSSKVRRRLQGLDYLEGKILWNAYDDSTVNQRSSLWICRAKHSRHPTQGSRLEDRENHVGGRHALERK